MKGGFPMLLEVVLILILVVAISILAGRAYSCYYINHSETTEAKQLANYILEEIRNKPSQEFILRYIEEVLQLDGGKVISRYVPISVWRKLLSILMQSNEITVGFVVKDDPPVDIKITKKEPSN